MIDVYDIRDHYWIVAGDMSRAWSSAARAYVPVYPPDRLSRIGSEVELSDVLRPYGVQGPYVASEDVDAERDRRMGTFIFDGKVYDLKAANGSLQNVLGAGTLALAAIIDGAQAGNLRWAGPDEDFTWIANDNAIVPMDAQTTWAFAQAAAGWRKQMIYRGRALKDQNPIPADFATNEAYWS